MGSVGTRLLRKEDPKLITTLTKRATDFMAAQAKANGWDVALWLDVLMILLLPLSFIPSVWGESRFNSLAYMLSRWRTPERRELDYVRQTGASGESASCASS